MTRRVRTLVTLGLVIQMLLVTPLAIGEEPHQVDRIVEAVGEALCFSVYWGGSFGYGGDYQRGVPVPFRLVMRGDAFYVSLKPIGFVGPRHQPVEAKFVGTHHQGRPVVASNSAYEWDAVFADSKPIEGHLTIPRDCTPRYAAWSPVKDRMVATVVSTMERRLKTLGITSEFPTAVQLLIADFNVEYPSTYVLVEQPKQHLFMLSLHNPQDYESDQYERMGEYPLSYIVVQPHLVELLQKIRANSIKRHVVPTK